MKRPVTMSSSPKFPNRNGEFARERSVSSPRSGGSPRRPAMSATPLEWKFSQAFGERAPGEPIEEVDIISAIEFEGRGEYLATGDRGGRVVLFQRTNGKCLYSQKELEHRDYPAAVHPRYVYKAEFQSHEPEFDYLKSLEIEEKINKLRWCATPNNSLFILSANDRTVKLWKILEHKSKKVKEMYPSPHVLSENTLLAENSYMSGENELPVGNGYSTTPSPEVPNLGSDTGVSTSARCRRVYAHAHDYNINSISNNSDCETFISSDDLRINLWNLEISNQCFNIVDMKPLDMEDLVEVITSAEFHPSYCNLLAYSSSRGFIRLVDMRRSALCDQSARILQDRESHGSRSFFTEIIASISDIKFAKDGRYMLSRDYMNLKLWDLRMESSPVVTFKMHEHLRPKLSELYNNDAIFDKFTCCLSRDGHHFASGSYSNTFKVFSLDGDSDEGTTLEASKNPFRASHQAAPKTARLLTSLTRGHIRKGQDTNNGLAFDSTSKTIHLSWHPTANLIACASKNSLYMYHV